VPSKRSDIARDHGIRTQEKPLTRKVLIVDDQADIRDIARVGIELTTDWEVMVACSGQEAVEIATEHRPDAILLDVLMPEMDGPAAVRALRAHPATHDIPVILLTARMMLEGGDDLAEISVSGLLSKPFDPMSLADSVSSILGWAA
jgi:two-component system alkaline phosphatase synthesis response regulator PhoP